MNAPQHICFDFQGRWKRYLWHPLDPAKAYMGATWGLRGSRDTTYLLVPETLYPNWTHRMIAVGQYSGLYNMDTGEGHFEIYNNIERILKAHPENLDIDQKIKKADFDSWKVA